MYDLISLKRLITHLIADFSGSAAESKPAAIPIKHHRPTASNSSIQKPATSTGYPSLTRSMDMTGLSSKNMDIVNDDVGRVRSYEKHSRHSASDDDQEDSPPQFRKLARSVPSMASSPKQSRSNLNAYGVPTSFPAAIATTQKKNSTGDLTDRIRVCVRKRPLNKKELKRGESDIARVNGRRTIAILEPKYLSLSLNYLHFFS